MSARRRRKRARGRATPGRTAFLLPLIRDEWPHELKDAVAIRNSCATEGRCPSCGALGELRADREHAGVFHLTFLHEHACRALTDEAA